ncbi:NAD(P)/FAD-dependent oxidoreductase [Paenibacillus flagellatus]|uniref:NADH:ubiquinone reductase (non-electrogenic) n=1 Tax=Paenibacillus flagellatus TaxID=2211139 RepID=A0A2V5KA80_9BACL|nr:FAD-dependent oxidoreductase [Paenibacillus flagellatus]PYI56338.1 pyridine nucleotide-disulfide oxidoreductase [Paenibacillus flagellatus]
MNEWKCVIVGGGHAGLHAAKTVWQSGTADRPVRVTVIDKQPYHVRKVLLFRPAVGDEPIAVPWEAILPDGVRYVRGEAVSVESEAKRLLYRDAEGNERWMEYDALIWAAGSVVNRPNPGQGGIALTDPEAAASIRERWCENVRKAALETDPAERGRLLTVAVAGAGISGIETSAELAHRMRQEAESLGLSPDAVRIYLLNAQDRLFSEGPAKVAHKLERLLAECGVTVLHRKKALREHAGQLMLEDGRTMPVGLCVWTLGLSPNPMLSRIGLPLTPQGQIAVDSCYRVPGMPFVYGIGDCAHIVDPISGRADRMTCKEGIAQASRLGKIVQADREGRPAPSHKGVFDFFCIGLGPNRGLTWTRKWGLDFVITGKLAWSIKTFVWDRASMLR